MRGSRKRRFQLFPPNNPAACFLRRLHLRVFIRLPVPRALLPSFRRIYPAQPPLLLSLSTAPRSEVSVKVAEGARCGQSSSFNWLPGFPNYLPECIGMQTNTRLSEKAHLIAIMQTIKLYIRTNNRSNY